MVSHAVWKTWPSGLSNDKNLGIRPRFLSTESLGPCFSHGTGDHDQILQQIRNIKSSWYANTLHITDPHYWSFARRIRRSPLDSPQGLILGLRPADERRCYFVKPRSHCADLAVPISTIWKIVDIGMVGSWSRGNIVLTSCKSARSGNDRQWSGNQYDKVLL